MKLLFCIGQVTGFVTGQMFARATCSIVFNSLNFFLWYVTCVGPCDGLIPIQGVLQNVYKEDSEICKTGGPGPNRTS